MRGVKSISDPVSMFTTRDLQQLESRGISVSEAERQLELLRHAPPPTRLVRPCTVGDGIVSLDESQHDDLLKKAHAAVAQGRVTKFVPASGAATRMFKELAAALDASTPLERDDAARQFFAAFDRFPFAQELRQRAAIDQPQRDDDDQRHVLRTLLYTMNYAELPKALIAFHRIDGTVRTAFEEQLREGAAYTRDREGIARTHFTVAPEFRDAFAQHLQRIRSDVERATNSRLDVSFSEQHPATDTLAATLDGDPFRQANGSLLFRPAGHGALLRNLEALNGDLVVIKNIDNVQPFESSGEVIRWKLLLIGYLLTVLDGAPSDRPVRVCGVVKNEGEPGGAPFWVMDGNGVVSPQLVEASQVNRDDEEQRAILQAATHFNPVDLVCAVRDQNGRTYDLTAFADPTAVFRAIKSHEGRDVVALERPGLWNGAMAGWHTVFVEVPAATFAPVKTVFDLLRPQHQWSS
jgi:hypothetical protein